MPKIEGVYLPGIGGGVFEGVKPPGAIFSPGKFLDSIDVLGSLLRLRISKSLGISGSVMGITIANRKNSLQFRCAKV